jgi:MraZ protein
MTGMNSLFRGRFEIKLDGKGRLSMPQAFRQILPDQPAQIVVTNSRYKNQSCLHAYSLTEWQNLERRISKLSALKTDVQAFQRFYLSGGQVVDVDGQGRVSIPQSLRKFAGLETQIILVGLGAKFEIWSQNSWQFIYEQLTENFEETLSAVASLDVSQDGTESGD